MKLRLYLQNEIGLMPETVMALDELFAYKELPKNHMLCSSGGRSKDVFFIEEGLVRSFYHKDGKDITDFFYKENTFFLSVENIFLNREDHYNGELLEKSKIRMINYNLLEPFLDNVQKLNYFMRHTMAYHIKLLNDRLYDIQFQSAEYRYQKLMENSPDLILRASLGNIASYLGITQQTLSVIRAGQKRK
ncbi:cAMP-binding domain of CRP or a regulatory subunit of cAMP-dependent protein kinases [Chryseobacterium oleae]|uniref:cAMP-binding domain of CRP or a regulatory subunit of cAMP-dependent protein kinases n=1 Tax=Chryseobacterium oleae TaxID=491207 RepID=A0A1I5A6I2_CHROL|nr:Crp/Fnr family transcriptional regulator [Chryseobacterium oleae]SFN58046.1 cAMP-binding domain of CRP or a regulatory subunit of cAMP-dependent protein kinases [Chryseobacterium oleae]